MKKSFLVRVLSLMLALLCCCGCLFSCKDSDGDADNGDSSDNATQSEWKIGSGSATFRIVYPKNPQDTVKMALESLLSAFESKTGVRPETADDYLQKGKMYDSSTYEILLGRTKHEQTQNVLGELENGQYAIRIVGKKIVITAPKDTDITAAVNYFISNYIEQNMTEADGKYLLSVSDYTSEAVVVDNTVTINGNSIADYKIVYETGREGYMYVAYMLEEAMTEMGYNVKAVSDKSTAETAGAKEILVGKTNRSVSQRLYTETSPNFLTYKLVVEGTYVQLVCGGPHSAKICASDMLVKFFNAEDKAYGDGVYMNTDLNTAANTNAAGTELRVMTLNVLAQRYYTDGTAEDHPVAQRAELFAAMLLTCKPDVIGLQETDKDWISALPYYLDTIKRDYGMEYTWLFTDFESRETLTTVIYMSDKYNLLGKGIENASWWTRTDYNIRLCEWVYLAEKANASHKFILTNTHWGFGENVEGGNQDELEASVQQSIDLVDTLKIRYPNVPIFNTGDFNSANAELITKPGVPKYTEYTNKFIAQTGCFDAMLKAKEKGTRVNDCGGSGKVGSVRFENEGYAYVDHIACYGSTIDILKYETVTGNNIYMTDHSPHIIDVKLWAS